MFSAVGMASSLASLSVVPPPASLPEPPLLPVVDEQEQSERLALHILDDVNVQAAITAAQLAVDNNSIVRKKKRGRPKETDTPAAFARAEAQRRCKLKVDKKLSLEGCSWHESKQCGHSCSAAYPPALIQKLRMYILGQPKPDQRQFLHPSDGRVILDQERIRKGGNLSGVKLYSGFRLERPGILSSLLNTAMLTTTRLPAALPEECQPCCLKFLLFAVGKSSSFFNRRDKHLPRRTNYSKSTERLFEVNPTRRSVAPRPDPKTTSVIHWLEQQRREHLVMPNETYTVLSYVDRRQAHTMYALDMERLHACEYAQESADVSFDGFGALDDLDDAPGHYLDPEQEEKVLELASRSRARSRYGNEVMGPRGRLPEHPSIASFSWFNCVWKKYPGPDGKTGYYDDHVKIRKWMPFAKCNACAEYREAVAATSCLTKKKTLQAAHALHIARVKRERRSYMVRRKLAEMYPHRFLSIIIDGADSTPYELPHTHLRTHRSDQVPKVKMHLIGAIAHGRNTYAFTCPPHIAQGHNITIQVLHDVLVDIKQREQGLPPHVHIQLDNTTKQNKGKGLLAYLGFLVQQGVVKRAFCNYLPVGHTHEDIDQFFSRVSVWSRHHNIRSVKELGEAVQRCFRKYGRSPIVAH